MSEMDMFRCARCNLVKQGPPKMGVARKNGAGWCDLCAPVVLAEKQYASEAWASEYERSDNPLQVPDWVNPSANKRKASAHHMNAAGEYHPEPQDRFNGGWFAK